MGQRTWAALLSIVVLGSILLLNTSKSSKVLLASNFAIYDQLMHLAPKNQKISMLVPFGQDTHTFQPSPKNVTMIVDAVAFFYTSKGMDQWVGKMEALKNAHNAIDLSDSIQWIKDEHHASHTRSRDYAFDPHYWLDIDNQMNVSRKIAQKLVEIFPDDTLLIENNLKDYLLKLETLENNYNQTLGTCKKKTLFVTHDAFAYIEQKGFFSVESVVGLAPEIQPNPARVQMMIQKLEKSNVKTIFFESFISDKMAIAIAKEVGIVTNVLDTLATISADQAKNSVTYIELMQNNLMKMAKALECQ